MQVPSSKLFFAYGELTKANLSPTCLEVNLASSEQEVDDGLLRFPHFLLSLSRGIDKLIEALKVAATSPLLSFEGPYQESDSSL